MIDTNDFSKLKGKKLKSALNDVLKEPEWRSNLQTLIDIHRAKLTNGLFAASYNQSPIIKWHAISGFGLLTNKLWDEEPEKVRIIMRRCIWMLTEESGGIPWSAPEIMSEIISANKDLADSYSDILFSYINEIKDGPDNFLEHTPLRKGVFWGLMRLSATFPDKIKSNSEILMQRIRNENAPEIMALICLIAGHGNITHAKDYIKTLTSDDRIVELYIHEKLFKATIGEIAAQALIDLNEK
ncbi:DVU0298 family protein [Bacteroidota bacterium]